MLLLITLFSVVLCLFLYSLRTDKGKHTKYARADYRSSPIEVFIQRVEIYFEQLFAFRGLESESCDS